MRISGTLLLIGGFLLCISIIWAAPGFLMMGFGLICLLIAERRQKRLAGSTGHRSNKIADRLEPSLFPAQQEAQSGVSTTGPPVGTETRRGPPRLRERKTAKPAGSTASRFDQIGPHRVPSRPQARKRALPTGATVPRYDKVDRQGEPAFFRHPEEPKLALVLSERPDDQSEIEAHSHNAERWNLLVKNDVDIARAAAALAPFGQKYVDELARAYLVLNDKDYLSIIFKKITDTARKDTGKISAGAAAIDSNANGDLIGLALGRTRSLGVEQTLLAQTVDAAVPDRFVFLNDAAQVKADAERRQAAVQSEKSRGRHEGATSAAVRDARIEGADTGPAVKTIAISPARREATSALGPDDVEDLTDLLNSLDFGARASAKR